MEKSALVLLAGIRTSQANRSKLADLAGSENNNLTGNNLERMSEVSGTRLDGCNLTKSELGYQ
jgi:hypothetical protein